MRLGDKSDDVRILQQALARAGFSPGRIDGVFGLRTHRALISYQRAHDLDADGIAGPKTMGRIAAMDPARPDSLEHVAVAALPHASRTNIRMYWPLVRRALAKFDLNGDHWIAMALGTIAAESEGFAPIDEGISRYNTDPGEHAFNRYDSRLGNDRHGDGARYKGRGFIQLTGRANYRKFGHTIGFDLEGSPQQANDPETAALVLAAFLASRRRRIERALEMGDMRQAREAVNGGSHGIDRFTKAYQAAMAAMKGRS